MPDSGPEVSFINLLSQGPGTGAPCCAALGRRSLSFLRGSSVQALKPSQVFDEKRVNALVIKRQEHSAGSKKASAVLF